MSSKVVFKRKELNEVVRTALTSAVNMTALELQNKVRTVLNQKGTGTVYRLKGGGTHQASAKGQPPAPRTGMLRNSWTVSPINIGKNSSPRKQPNLDVKAGSKEEITVLFKQSSQGGFGSALRYAEILEIPNKLDRPYLLPSVKALKKKKSFQKHVREQLKLRIGKYATSKGFNIS